MKTLSDAQIAYEIKEIAYNLENISHKDAKKALTDLADAILFKDELEQEHGEVTIYRNETNPNLFGKV